MSKPVMRATGRPFPVKTYTDARGHTIKVGTRVAINYSGSIAVGTVEKITPGGEFHIRRETHLNAYYGNPNPISKIKNVQNLLAIFEVEDIEKVRQGLGKAALEDFAKANDELIRVVRDAWDLHEVELYFEEKYGKDWKENLG